MCIPIKGLGRLAAALGGWPGARVAEDQATYRGLVEGFRGLGFRVSFVFHFFEGFRVQGLGFRAVFHFLRVLGFRV